MGMPLWYFFRSGLSPLDSVFALRVDAPVTRWPTLEGSAGGLCGYYLHRYRRTEEPGLLKAVAAGLCFTLPKTEGKGVGL
jgi:hypothetical protein